jgi:hypothetical protein
MMIYRLIVMNLFCLPLLCAGFARASSSAEPTPEERIYLKQEGARWTKVVRKEGVILSRATLQTSTAPDVISARLSTPSAGNRFRPYLVFPVGSWPEAVSIGDLNGDGLDDVALVTSFYFDPANDNSLHVFLQDGAGGFQPVVRYAVGGSPSTVDVGDVNGDFRDDVVIGRGDGIVVMLQNASGTLEAGVTYPTTSSFKIRIGDLNSDGRQDVAGINWGARSQEIHVFLQRADGTLTLAAKYDGSHGGHDDLEVGDLNQDDRDDLVVMSGQGFAANLSVLLQKPEGLFSPATPYDLGGNELTQGIGIGDLNGDGRSDLAASYGGNSPNAHIAIWTQNDAGALEPPVSLTSYDIPEPVEVADISSDGRLDVVVAHGGWMRLGVYVQRPDGTLSAEDLYPIPYASHYNSHGLAVGDVNGDGADDVVIADYNHGLVVLYQTPLSVPPPPENLTAVASAGQVALSWSAAAGADTYTVKRSEVSGGPYGDLATNLTLTTYTDTNVINGTTYYYVVTASNAAGESAPSNEVAARPARPRPAAPSGLEAFVLGHWVVLHWNPVRDADSYIVRRATTPGGPYHEVANNLTRTLFFERPPAGIYYYVVSAVNESAEGPLSDEVVARVRVTGAW